MKILCFTERGKVRHVEVTTLMTGRTLEGFVTVEIIEQFYQQLIYE